MSASNTDCWPAESKEKGRNCCTLAYVHI
jgi:hypothetical protein